MASEVDEIIVDSFAGGGGASTGIEMALGRSPDVAINHEPDAIAMHQVNHPDTQHYCQNIWQADPKEVCGGRQVGLAWFSPDCKHFSKAKGSKPVNRNVRDLAWVTVMWAEQVRPRVIIVENVEEFEGWGPIGDDGLPCKARKGETFNEWVRSLRRLGYKVQWRQLRACDYGAPTIRKRLFIIARCDGKRIVWPKASHADPRKPLRGLLPWRSAAECIDWSFPCPSIFMTPEEAREWRQATGQSVKRPLAEATMRRIAQGIKRFVIDAEQPFIVTANHQGQHFRGQSLTEPMKTITAARDAHGLVTPFLTEHANASKQGKWSAEEPLRTQCANVKGGHFAVVAPTMVQTGYGEREGQSPRALDIHKPLGTVVAGGTKHALVEAFMVKHFGGVVGTELTNPCPTITTRATQNQIVASNLVKLRGTCKDGQPLTEPMPTLTAGGNHVGEVRAFLQKYYGSETSQQQECTDPLHTIPTKERFGLVVVNGSIYRIEDIGMRMLQPKELFAAQSFPPTYKIDQRPDGSRLTKTAQVSNCGNSVPPVLAKAIVAAQVPEMAVTRRAAE